jgi:hypothetical protein
VVVFVGPRAAIVTAGGRHSLGQTPHAPSENSKYCLERVESLAPAVAQAPLGQSEQEMPLASGGQILSRYNVDRRDEDRFGPAGSHAGLVLHAVGMKTDNEHL